MHTPNTTRIPYGDPELCSIAVSQTLYPSSEASWRANAVIVVNGQAFSTVVPAVSLIHFPFNAPILLSNQAFFANGLWNEITRLHPSGKDVPAQIILVGDFHLFILQQLQSYGYSVLHFNHPDPLIQSIHIFEWRKRLLPEMMPEMITKNTLLISVDTPTEALPSFGFSAHMGTPMLYTDLDQLPDLTKKALQAEAHRNVTILGSEKTISKRVEETVKSIVHGAVERFDGENFAQIAVNLAKNKSQATQIGWGRSAPEKGDAFTFFPADWRFAMIASPLSHLGKHTPLLPIRDGSLSKIYKEYLEYLRPRGVHPKPPYMHAFILGDYEQFPFHTQVEIEEYIKFNEINAGHE